ncbi:MAG: hypothetical protein AAF533_18230 [Acidobacteriota bacterium]
MTNTSKMQLIHGGHRGTEAEFGRLAETWQVPQTTLSFEGHEVEHGANVEVLSDEVLETGRVSMEFVFQVLGRRFVTGKGLRRVLYSMFHVVVRSDSLFAIGWIKDDGTVKGGTGWGVELAKLFNRPVHVYDQDKNGWFRWEAGAWQPAEARLPEGTFSATGTRHLTDAGKQAISDLFESSLEGVERPVETAAAAHS